MRWCRSAGACGKSRDHSPHFPPLHYRRIRLALLTTKPARTMSEILGHSSTEVEVDTAFPTEGSWDSPPPDGFRVTCLGLQTEGGNGNVGVLLQVTIPGGYVLIQNQT